MEHSRRELPSQMEPEPAGPLGFLASSAEAAGGAEATLLWPQSLCAFRAGPSHARTVFPAHSCIIQADREFTLMKER